MDCSTDMGASDGVMGVSSKDIGVIIRSKEKANGSSRMECSFKGILRNSQCLDKR